MCQKATNLRFNDEISFITPNAGARFEVCVKSDPEAWLVQGALPLPDNSNNIM